MSNQASVPGDFVSTNIPSCALRVLQTLYDEKLFCDVTISTKDNREYAAHAPVLAAGSPVLKASLLQQDQIRQLNDNSNKKTNKYKLMINISGDVMETILRLVYTGNFVTSKSNCTAAKIAARALSIPCADLIFKDTCNDESGVGKTYLNVSCEVKYPTASGMYNMQKCKVDQLVGNVELLNALSDSDDDTIDAASVESIDRLPGRDVKIESSNDVVRNERPKAADEPSDVKEEKATIQNMHSPRSHDEEPINDSPGLRKEEKTTLQHMQDHRYNAHESTMKRYMPSVTTMNERPCSSPKATSENANESKSKKSESKKACQVCKHDVPSSKLLEHIYSEHVKKKSKLCPICGKIIQDLRKHIRMHLNAQPYQCQECCDRTFHSKHNLTAHINKMRGEKPFQCEVCPSRFYNELSRSRHVAIIHERKGLSCDECGHVVQYKNELKQHKMQQHSTERPFACDKCPKAFASERIFKKHVMSIHEHMKIYKKYKYGHKKWKQKCPECGMDVERLKEHLRKHTGEKPLECPQCQKTFRYRTSLRRHAKSHISTSSQQFTCPTCDKVFATEERLKSHSNVHLEVKPFSCDLCDSRFSSRVAQRSHIRSHQAENNVPCGECNKTFRSRASLKTHEATHTGEKRHVCDHCGIRLSSISAVERHTRVVHEKRPLPVKFQCEVCKKGFPFRGTYRAHLRMHTGETPFLCEECGKAFKTPHGAKKHKRVMHGIGKTKAKIFSTSLPDPATQVVQVQTASLECSDGNQPELVPQQAQSLSVYMASHTEAHPQFETANYFEYRYAMS